MENKTSFVAKVKIKLGEIFTLAHIKRAGMVVLIFAVTAGAGGVYWHQQETDAHMKIVQARTRMIEAQAAKNNIMLLDREKIKEIVAEAIGLDGSNIEYKQIELTAEENDRYSGKDVKKHKKDDKELVRNHEFTQKPVVMQTETVASTATKVDNLVISHPVYKVVCKANTIKYRLRIDAVTGQILNSKVADD